jgi:molecular chaperone GrpE (heat shock protein)
MNRSIERWSVCSPLAMANQSNAAIKYAFEDARHDILELHDQLRRAKNLLKIAAYPRRGTNEESMLMIDYAELIQSVYTIEQLEQVDQS